MIGVFRNTLITFNDNLEFSIFSIVLSASP